MKPAFSVISFTAAAGAAQGLVVMLAVATLTGRDASSAMTLTCLAVALVLLVLGLGASFLHLGRPERAWRAMAMWRTSWLSREVIVLPAFIVLVAAWSVAVQQGLRVPALPAAAVLGAALLWLCTARIYACLRFIAEWAHPLTLITYTLTGLASGAVLSCALAAAVGDGAWLAAAGPWALTLTFAAWAARSASLARNATLKPRSTAQSATGLHAPRVVQKSMGMSAGAFNTREFFHGATAVVLRQVRWLVHGLAYAGPAALMVAAVRDPTAPAALWWAAAALQAPGVMADRWLFFAQARHPQNLYYQAVS